MHKYSYAAASLAYGNPHCLWDVESFDALDLPPQSGCLLNAEVSRIFGTGVLLRPAGRPAEQATQKRRCLQLTYLALATGI